MNSKFEKKIKLIKVQLQKEINQLTIVSLIIIGLSLILGLIFHKHFIYFLLSGIIGLLIGIIPLFFSRTKKRLNEILKTYQDNKQEVIDYLTSVVQNATLYHTNYFIRRYNNRYLELYKDALYILMNEKETA